MTNAIVQISSLRTAAEGIKKLKAKGIFVRLMFGYLNNQVMCGVA